MKSPEPERFSAQDGMARQGVIGVLPVVFLLVVGVCFVGCSTGVEHSEEFGLLRVIVQSAPSDTAISIVGETLAVDTSDVFQMTFSQGKAYSKGSYAILYHDTLSYRQEDIPVNVLELSEDDAYVPCVVFESFVPPGVYDSLEFGLSARQMTLGEFTIPVQRPQGRAILEILEHDYTVEPEQTTELVVYVYPFTSLQRYQDRYLFVPELEIAEVNHP